MNINGNKITFELENIPKKNYRFINDYTIRKALSYTLQIANGKLELEGESNEETAVKFAEFYMSFWNENMIYTNYELYTRVEWGGIGFFFVVASMRRFNKLYKNSFDIVKVLILKK